VKLLRKKVETTDSMTEAGIRRAALVVATLSSFMAPFMGSSINIALPSIAKEFGIDAVLLSWIPTSYLLATAVCLVPFGRLADIYGERRYSASAWLLSTSPPCFVPPLFNSDADLLQGLSRGGWRHDFFNGVAILTSVFPLGKGQGPGFQCCGRIHRAFPWTCAGRVLTHYFTWRSIFLVNVLFGIVIICFLLLKMKVEWAEARGEKFDLAGAAIYGVAILGVIYGLSLLPSLISFLYLIIGSLALFGFVKRELNVREPVFDLHFFVTNRVFAFSNLTALINYSGLFALTFLLSLYLQHIKGLGTQAAGLILVSQPIMMALSSPFGALQTKSNRIVASVGMALSTFSLFLLVFLTGLRMGHHQGTIVLGRIWSLYFSQYQCIMGSVERKFMALPGHVTMRFLNMINRRHSHFSSVSRTGPDYT
jgi:MFS family permease